MGNARHSGDDATNGSVVAVTVIVGLLTGLAIATRTGGIITHAYLLAGLLLCAGNSSPRTAA